MNGRVYDPQIGKFISADPTTSHPYSTQGWNRYAYVENNPLNATDPTGFYFFGPPNNPDYCVGECGDGYIDGLSSSVGQLWIVSIGGDVVGIANSAWLQSQGYTVPTPDEVQSAGNNMPIQVGVAAVEISAEPSPTGDANVTSISASLQSPGSANGQAASQPGPTHLQGSGLITADRNELRKDAYDHLPYGQLGTTGWQIKHEFGSIGYQIGIDSEGRPLFTNSNPIEGDPTAVPFRVGKDANGHIFTLNGVFGINGQYPVVEFDHTHIVDSLSKEAEFFSGGSGLDGDIPLSKATSAPIFMRYDNHLNEWTPDMHADRDQYGGGYANTMGKTICKGVQCF